MTSKWPSSYFLSSSGGNVLELRDATLNEVLPIQHQVLWPDDSLESCIVEGDETALHFAVFIDSQCVCVASI